MPSITVQQNIFLRTSIVSKSKGDIWFIHGFGESGLSFIESLDSCLAPEFNLYIPDLPGFGASPLSNEHPTQKTAADALHSLVLDISSDRPVYFVAHSQGGLIGTWLCERFANQVKAYVNVEGNLTKADITFSGKAAAKDTPEDCKGHILKFIRDNADNEESFWRYYASLRFASARALLGWAKAGIEFTGDTKAGDEYASLKVPKLYLWGAKSCPKQTINFLNTNNLTHFCFERSGHWPMIDETERFYGKIREFFNGHAK